MPSTLRRSQQRALTFSRSLANTIKSKLLSSSFFHHTSKPPVAHDHLRHSNDISRPRHLRRTQYHTDISHSHQPTHFIRRLPVEILAHIFVLGSQQDAAFPIAISHVCRAWRYIALRTPSLWRCIILSPHEQMWRERIHRARACTLDIRLITRASSRLGQPRTVDVDPFTVQWHMHIVLPHIQRWRSLDIEFPEYAPFLWKAALSNLSYGAPAAAPLLEDLSLVYRDNDDVDEFCLFSGYAPRLRRVTLDGIRLTWLPSLFSNLTFLDYTHHGFTTGYQAVHDVISILQVSSRLVELRLAFPPKRTASLPSWMDSVTQRVTLPLLASLHLRVEGGEIPFELAHLVTLMSTPSLTSLRLIDPSRGHHPFPQLKSFFYVYALPPSLRTLCIEHGWYDHRMISPMAHALPRIRQIIVKRAHAPEQVLNINRAASKPSDDLNFGRAGSAYNNRHLRIHRLDVRYLSK